MFSFFKSLTVEPLYTSQVYNFILFFKTHYNGKNSGRNWKFLFFIYLHWRKRASVIAEQNAAPHQFTKEKLFSARLRMIRKKKV